MIKFVRKVHIPTQKLQRRGVFRHYKILTITNIILANKGNTKPTELWGNSEPYQSGESTYHLSGQALPPHHSSARKLGVKDNKELKGQRQRKIKVSLS